MIFGKLYAEKILHENLTDLSTWLIRCSHFAFGNPKSHFQQYYTYTLLMVYVIIEENKL